MATVVSTCRSRTMPARRAARPILRAATPHRLRRPGDVFMNGALANRTSAGYGPLPQPQFEAKAEAEAEAETSLILRMDNLLVGTLSPVTQIGETACLL